MLLVLAQNALGDVIDGELFVDPTVPLTTGTQEDEGIDIDFAEVFRTIRPEDFELNFVRLSSNNPIAVINNQRVTIGDVVGGATVAKISRSSVTLLIGEQEQIIGLYDTVVKRAAVTP